MKVCIVSLNIVPYFYKINESQFGGAEVQAAVLAEAFRAAGVEVVLAVSDLRNGQELPFPTENAFLSDKGLVGTRFFYPRLTGIINALERADADVYVQHCAGMITGLTSWFCRRHGKTFVYFAGSDTDFSFRRARVGNIRDRILFYWGLRHADGIVAQNEYQAAACRGKLGVQPRIIPTAVVAGDPGSSRKDGSVVWVGALRSVKRPELFLELARRFPEIRFVLIGGDIATQADLGQKIAAAAGSLTNVTATGRVERDQVERYLAKASVLVNTSSVEGFPNAFLEAWKNYVPILSFVDVDGLLQDEKVGTVCRDVDDMEDRLRSLLTNDAEREEMGRRARRLIEERYAVPRLAGEFIGYFRELIERRRTLDRENK